MSYVHYILVPGAPGHDDPAALREVIEEYGDALLRRGERGKGSRTDDALCAADQASHGLTMLRKLLVDEGASPLALGMLQRVVGKVNGVVGELEGLDI